MDRPGRPPQAVFGRAQGSDGLAAADTAYEVLCRRHHRRRLTAARSRGGRVVAVGTTVVRALESVAGPDGSLRAGSGFTELVLDLNRSCRVVDGLVTGWHEPDASHLLLLEALAGPDLVERAYAAALAARYRWHEFGDSCLLLPHHSRPPRSTTSE